MGFDSVNHFMSYIKQNKEIYPQLEFLNRDDFLDKYKFFDIGNSTHIVAQAGELPYDKQISYIEEAVAEGKPKKFFVDEHTNYHSLLRMILLSSHKHSIVWVNDEGSYVTYFRLPYLDCYRPDKQKLVDGIPIDPILPYEFDSLDNRLRHNEEIDDWWGLPFILTSEFSWPDDSYEEHVIRAKKVGFTVTQTKEKWESERSKAKKNWIINYPDGKQYAVRCLDGGAWDRSSWKGTFPSLDEAILKAKNLM